VSDRLAGKVAVITGGAGGFGQAIARAFGREGALVIITDVNRDAVSNVADALGCLGLEQDVTDEAKWTEIIAAAEQRHGKLDILVNNAGILGDLGNGSPEEPRLKISIAFRRSTSREPSSDANLQLPRSVAQGVGRSSMFPRSPRSKAPGSRRPTVSAKRASNS
jgi:NAD(P)-dependent dehydrogenase (short-subunit alcohol dehydrogenase family)